MDNHKKAFKKVVFRSDAQNKILEGAEILASAVGSTMGPSGHNVIIDNPLGGTPKITKDGVTVARSIVLEDKLNSVGVELLKEVASKTNDISGDGTTTATVLAFNLLKEGTKLIATGISPIEIKKGMDGALAIVVNFLKQNCVSISKKEDIMNVASISSNGDKEIGMLIASAIASVGNDGLIAIENAKTVATNLRVADGMQIDSGFLSPWFITNSEKQICELENPAVLITPNKISKISEIVPLLEQIDNSKKSLLIIADDVEGEALHTLIVNKTKGVIKVCAIKAPSYGEFRSDILSDISAVVDGVILGATSEIAIEKIKLDNLGNCKKAIINRNACTIIVDEKNKKIKSNIETKAQTLREALKNDINLDQTRKEKYRQRLAKLSGGIAIIEIGGSTEVEVLEKRDRVEDAVNATQAALQEGIVPGGGTALFYASLHLDSIIKAGFLTEKQQNEDIIAGMKLISNVCMSPFNTIIKNTGVSPEVISEKLKQNWAGRKAFFVDLENIDRNSLEEFIDDLMKNKKINVKENDLDKLSKSFVLEKDGKNKFEFGYDAQNKTYCNLVEKGIIDPVKVTRHALEHAVSVVGLMLTSNAIIISE
jgi:chaperonin GroEL